MGLKVWLTVHYSDIWVDPGHQEPPAAWKNITYNALKDSVYTYTKKIATTIKPDYIQIGNEINSGFIHPQGNINTNEIQFLELLSLGIKAVRDHSTQTKIMLHYAGVDSANRFYGKVSALDYDIIGLYYYPIWHGKDLNKLKNTISNLGDTYKKEVVIAETAYPFTL